MKKNKISNLFERSPFFASVVVFFVVFAILSSFYLSADIISSFDDHFFHYKYSKLLRTEGLDVERNFKWVYFSRFNQGGEEYETTFFHYALMPFTLFSDDVTGLKVADITWAALLLAILFFTLRVLKVPYSFLYVLLIMTSVGALHMYLSGRNYVLVPGFVLLEFYFALKNKKAKLFGISLFHLIWHQATFFLPVMIVIIVEAARYIETKKAKYKNVLVALGASLVGMIFYPNFLASFANLAKRVLQLHLDVATDDTMRQIEAIELAPKQINIFFEGSILFMLAFFVFIGIFLFFYIQSKNSKADVKDGGDSANQGGSSNTALYASFLVLLSFFSGMVLVSGRLYAFYFILVAFAFAIAVKKVFEEKKVAIDRRLHGYLLVAIALFMVFYSINTLINLRVMAANVDFLQVKSVAEWVDAKTETGEVVFLDNWSLFPILFFFNENNYYTMGMDPRALLKENPDLFWKWFNISKNQFICEEAQDCTMQRNARIKQLRNINEQKALRRHDAQEIIEVVKKDFQSRIIVSDNKSLNETLLEREDLVEEVFEGEGVYLQDGALKAFLLK